MAFVRSVKKSLKAGKGGATVEIDTNMYDEKMNSILNNEENYKKISEEITKRTETSMNEMSKKLENLKEEYLHPRSTDGKCPRIYRQAKIQKPNTPLRPIVSYDASPLCRVSQK